MNKEDLPRVFQQSAGFKLGVTYRKLSQVFTQGLKPFDITPEQWIVLSSVQVRDGSMQKDIAELAQKDRPTTTRILDTLEGKGLIARKTGEADRRSFHIHITAKGSGLLEQTLPIEQQTIQDATIGISAEEYEGLLNLLRRIDRNLDSYSDKE